MHRATTVLLSGALTAATLAGCGNGGEAMPCASTPPVEASQLNLSPNLSEARRLSQIELATMAARIACLAEREQDSTTVTHDLATYVDVVMPVSTGDSAAKHAVTAHLEFTNPKAAEVAVRTGKITDFSQVIGAGTYRWQYAAGTEPRNLRTLFRTPPIEHAVLQVFDGRTGRTMQSPSSGVNVLIQPLGSTTNDAYSSGIVINGRAEATGLPEITAVVVTRTAEHVAAMLVEAESQL